MAHEFGFQTDGLRGWFLGSAQLLNSVAGCCTVGRSAGDVDSSRLKLRPRFLPERKENSGLQAGKRADAPNLLDSCFVVRLEALARLL